MMKVALIGAGAVGAYFVWGFSKSEEVEFTVIATGERRERLAANGLTINKKLFMPKVAEPVDAGIQDMILVATKYSGLHDAIALLPDMVDEHTVILSLLNGVDSEDVIKAALPNANVLHSVMRIASVRDDDGVRFNPMVTEGVSYGATCEAENALVDYVDAIFNMGRSNHHIKENILYEEWLKYAGNIVNNLPQAIAGCNSSIYFESEHGRFLADRLWEELRRVAACYDITLPAETGFFPSAFRNSKYSTLQDLEAGRPTEVDMFAGKLIDMAKANGIEVPYTAFTYHVIKLLEEKNQGKFE